MAEQPRENEAPRINAQQVEDSEDDDQGQMRDKDEDNNQDNLGHKSLEAGAGQKKNMDAFVNNYGVSMEIPAFYIQAAKIFPAEPRYCVQVVNYVLPDSDLKVRTHYLHKPVTEQHLKETYKEEKYRYSSLKLMKQSDQAFKEIVEISIGLATKVSIEFSPDGQYLALLLRPSGVLKIYKIEQQDIEGLLGQIKGGAEPYMEFGAQDKGNGDASNQFQKTKNLEFDSKSKYLVCFGREKLNIISLVRKEEVRTFKVDPQHFKAILDVQLVSNDDNGRDDRNLNKDPYRCEVACRIVNQNSVVFFDINQEKQQSQVDQKRSLTYFNNDVSNLSVKISEDFTQAVLVNKSENYLLTQSDDHMYHQTSISWLQDKQVRQIYSHKSLFLFVCCKEYDRALAIMSSSNDQFKISIPRSIEPGIITVFDVHIEVQEDDNNQNDEGLGKRMQILSVRDEEFYVDNVNPQAALAKLQEQEAAAEDTIIINSFLFSKYRGFSSNWPYIAFQGLESSENFLWLINSYHQQTINRIELDKENVQISHTYLSESYDLFIVCEAENGYNLYYVNLDKYEDEQNREQQIFKVEPLFKYDKHNVEESKPLIALHVRASSAKEKIKMNQKLIVFFLHVGSLYSWTQGESEIQKVCDTSASALYRLDDNTIIVRDDFKLNEVDNFQLRQIEVEFSQYSVDRLYYEKQLTDTIKSFGFDYHSKILILMKAPKRRGQKVKQVKIYDLENEKLLWNAQVRNKELIGRLKSNLYTLVDGHIYYNNKVIKIRYDLLKKKNLKDLEEHEVFDYYENILSLDPKETVKTKMPFCSRQHHRFVYLTKNLKSLKPNKIKILPFLHERKIYLSRMNQSSDYFYTTIRRKNANNSYETFFITMNISEHKFYVYSQGGILQKRVDYSRYDYGSPTAVSNNGQIFIFRQPKSLTIHVLAMTLTSLEHIKTVDMKQAIRKYIQDLKGTEHEKDAGLLEERMKQEYSSYLEEKSKLKLQINDNMDIVAQISQAEDAGGAGQNAKQGDLDGSLFNPKQNKKKGTWEDRIKGFVKGTKGNIIYIQKGFVGLDSKPTPKNKERDQMLEAMGCELDRKHTEVEQQYLFITKYADGFFDSGMLGFSCNTANVFFWNEFHIWHLALNSPTTEFLELGLYVSSNEKQTQIKAVRTGSSNTEIAIMVRQSLTSDCVMTWDVKQDSELESFDLNLDPKIFWDADGHAYITEKEKVYITQQGVQLKCYDVGQVNSDQTNSSKRRQKFGYHHGYRFDNENHSWIYLRDYISLSYSYMTFVIKNKIQEESDHYLRDDYLFDLEQYNYIINKRTALTDDKMVATDHDKLGYILKSFDQIDPVLLEQIQYYHMEKEQVQEQKQEEGIQSSDEDDDKQKAPQQTSNQEVIVTPLHIAYQQRNNRSVKILLQYMSKIDFNASKTFKDILPNLIDYTGFTDYLWELPFQTTQMINKQTLRVQDTYQDKIVRISCAQCSYIDEAYYKEQMDENVTDTSYKSYPVKVVALRMQWILQEQGEQFLHGILRSENLDLYTIPTVQILIEYLYIQYKKVILLVRLPVYLFQLFIYFSTIYLNEGKFVKVVETPAGQDKSYLTLKRNLGHSMQLAILATILNLLIALYILLSTIQQGCQIGRAYFKSLWPYIDICCCALNIYISINIFLEAGESSSEPGKYRTTQHSQRIIEAIVAILIWTKSLYFMALIDEMAPLVYIIFKVFSDIQYFVVTMVIAICAFANAFYLIGKNQVQFDEIQPDNYPSYHELIGSLQYIYLMSLGELGADDDFFAQGKRSQELVLWLLFLLATFTLCIHLLNMLIAIMGETFAKNSEAADQNRMREHLHFIMDNWGLDPLGTKKSRINYLVTAFLNEEDEEDVEILKDLQEAVNEMRLQSNQELDSILGEIKKIKSKIISSESQNN